MSKQQDALRLALEALVKSVDNFPANRLHRHAIWAVREALAEESSGTEQPAQPQQQEPVAITAEQAYEMGAKGAEPAEEERLLFEAWMRGHCWAVMGEWDGKTYRHESEFGGYLQPGAMRTRQLWAAWRDRAALASPPAQQWTDETANVPDRVWDEKCVAGHCGWPSGCADSERCRADNTPAPQSETQGLSQRKPLRDEQIEDIWNRYCDEMGEASVNDALDIARAIEAAHGIKENT